MRLPASERARWTLAVAVGVLLLAGFNLWWVLTYRKGFPLNVDEAGYTSIALTDWLGFHNGGLHGWWSAIQSQAPTAPLVPALTSVLLFVRTGVMEGFAVLIGFFVLLAFAAYGIGERLAGPRLGALAALAVATSEGALLFSREYVFALPTAALLSCAVYALLRSERMRVRRWAIACGVALGLMVLARTMAVAFVPGVFAAALVAMLAIERTDLRQRFLNLALTAVVAVLVAGTWYFNNLKPVWEYLTDFGYGSESAYFGAEHAVVSWARFKQDRRPDRLRRSAAAADAAGADRPDRAGRGRRAPRLGSRGPPRSDPAPGGLRRLRDRPRVRRRIRGIDDLAQRRQRLHAADRDAAAAAGGPRAALLPRRRRRPSQPWSRRSPRSTSPPPPASGRASPSHTSVYIRGFG